MYDASNLHIGLRTLELYRSSIVVGDARLRLYGEALEEVSCRHAPVCIEYRGLTASTVGVLAQG